MHRRLSEIQDRKPRAPEGQMAVNAFRRRSDLAVIQDEVRSCEVGCGRRGVDDQESRIDGGAPEDVGTVGPERWRNRESATPSAWSAHRRSGLAPASVFA